MQVHLLLLFFASSTYCFTSFKLLSKSTMTLEFSFTDISWVSHSFPWSAFIWRRQPGIQTWPACRFISLYRWLSRWPFLFISLRVCPRVQVKLWHLCDPEQEQPGSPELTLRPGQGKLELVQFHPTSSGLLAVSASRSPLIWDTSRQDAPLAGSEESCTCHYVHSSLSHICVLCNISVSVGLVFKCCCGLFGFCV